MSNNPALNGIEAILIGDEPIPAKVSNRLIIMGIRQNYQTNLEIKEELTKIRNCITAIDNRVDKTESKALVYDEQFKQLNKDLQDLEKISSRWDKILMVFTVIGTALGSAFGNR